MFRIEANNEIVITRGDTGVFNISIDGEINGESKKILLAPGDVVKFTVKQTVHDRESILQKTLTNSDQNAKGNIRVKINPNDTASMEYGTYKYDFQAVLQQVEDIGAVTDTFIPPTDFTVTDEVTF